MAVLSATELLVLVSRQLGLWRGAVLHILITFGVPSRLPNAYQRDHSCRLSGAALGYQIHCINTEAKVTNDVDAAFETMDERTPIDVEENPTSWVETALQS